METEYRETEGEEQRRREIVVKREGQGGRERERAEG